MAGGAGAVVAVVLPAPGGSLGPGSERCFAFVLLAFALTCFNRLEPATVARRHPHCLRESDVKLVWCA